MIPVLTFVIGLLVSLGQLIDFLIGQEGNRIVKRKLVDVYITINEENWDYLVKAAGQSIGDLIRSRLGVGYKFIIRVSIISIILTSANIALLYFFAGKDTSAWRELFDTDGLVIFCIITFANAVADVCSWRILVRLFDLLPRVHGAVLIIVVILQAYITIVLLSVTTAILAMVFWHLSGGFPLGDIIDEIESYILDAQVFNPFAFSIIQSDEIGNINPFYVTSIIPHFLFLASCGSLIFFRQSERYLKEPISLIIQRSEESRHGLFTIAASILSGLVALISLANVAFTSPGLDQKPQHMTNNLVDPTFGRVLPQR